MDAARTASFTVHNRADADLIVGRTRIAEGVWSHLEPRPAHIPRGCTVTFNAVSEEIFGGTEGWIDYQIPGRRGTFHFSWRVPFQGDATIGVWQPAGYRLLTQTTLRAGERDVWDTSGEVISLDVIIEGGGARAVGLRSSAGEEWPDDDDGCAGDPLGPRWEQYQRARGRYLSRFAGTADVLYPPDS
ncbi:MAG: hypothetical protein U0Y82_11680 [Thermoleophilia bacterium]